MKIILLLAIFAVFANAALIPARKEVGRQVVEADNLMTLYFRGTCAQFDTIKGTIAVSHFNPTRYCLPIDSSLNDIDDTRVTFVCEDEGSYSRVRITESYDANVPPPPNESQQLTFMLAFKSFAPFRVNGGFYYRRPACTFVSDLCSGATPTLHVNTCQTNQVDLSDSDYHNKQWVLNRDTIYVTTNNQTIGDCYGEGGVATACCAYVTPDLLCNTTTDSSLFQFSRPRPQQQQHHQQHQQHNPINNYQDNNGYQDPVQPYKAPVQPVQSYQAPAQQHSPVNNNDDDYDDDSEYLNQNHKKTN